MLERYAALSIVYYHIKATKSDLILRDLDSLYEI